MVDMILMECLCYPDGMVDLELAHKWAVIFRHLIKGDSFLAC